MPVIATLRLPGDLGKIVLRTGGEDAKGRRFIWSSSKDRNSDSGFLGPLVNLANDYSNPPSYSYGPADGAPGRLAAQRVQELLGGKLTYAELPKEAPDDPDNPKVY